jgi:hypothetical protein
MTIPQLTLAAAVAHWAQSLDSQQATQALLRFELWLLRSYPAPTDDLEAIYELTHLELDIYG